VAQIKLLRLKIFVPFLGREKLSFYDIFLLMFCTKITWQWLYYKPQQIPVLQSSAVLLVNSCVAVDTVIVSEVAGMLPCFGDLTQASLVLQSVSYGG
jgi:hypothetical protein